MNEPNPELLRAEFLGITVRHEDVDHDREALALLFARSGERYELNRMEYTDGGATLTGASGSELVMRPSQTASAGVTALGFHEGLERVASLLEEAVAMHGHDRLWIDDITLVAVWDCEEDDAARAYLTDEVLGLDPERQELLAGDDPDEAAHGLRVWRRLGAGSLDIAIEPMHADTSKIYVRLVYSEDEPVADIPAVMERADAVNTYLHGPLVAFVRARARR